MAYQLTLRNVKGSPLTNSEVDTNFSNLYDDIQTRLESATYTATDVITKVKSVSEATANISVYKLNGLLSATSNTVSTIVARDSNGDFTAGTITATTVIANLTGNVVGNLTGTVTGNASNVSGTVALTNGGTGGTTASSARTNLGLGTLAVQNSSSISVTGGTITGITDIAIVDGGTGASTAQNARANLGLAIGSDIQPFSNELTGIAAATLATGFYVRLGTGSVTERSITVGGNGLTISNGDGVAGNPVISLPTSATPTFASLTTTAGINGVNITASGVLTGASLTVGNITSSGAITATGNITGFYSDDRLKNKLGKIENALDKLCSLEGFYFEANQTAKDLGYTDKKEVGVSAQSVQAVLPEIIHPAPIDPQYMTVDYARMMPLVIEAIKELRAEIQALK
jgi:hypothetical protein